MREILFRGKRLEDGKWLEGYYVKMLNPFAEDGKSERHFIYDGTPFNQEIDPETIGEYIGLTDVTGRRIFEGDIVMHASANGDTKLYSRPSVVEYDNYNCSCCSGVYGWAYNKGWADIRDDQYVLVIGNIHDNPELLEVGQR